MDILINSISFILDPFPPLITWHWQIKPEIRSSHYEQKHTALFKRSLTEDSDKVLIIH